MKRSIINTASAACLVVSLFLVGMGTVAAQELNTLSKKEKKQGWKLLFDGQGLAYVSERQGRSILDRKRGGASL